MSDVLSAYWRIIFAKAATGTARHRKNKAGGARIGIFPKAENHPLKKIILALYYWIIVFTNPDDMAKDYYEILEIPKTSTAEEIKKAYRKKAMQYHPDKNPGDKTAEAKFKEAAQAYEVLRDDDKRATYDRYGESAFNGAAGGAADFGEGDFGKFRTRQFNDFSDIFSAFSDIFGDIGGAPKKRAPSSVAGADLRYNASITLEEAYAGKILHINFTAPSKCDECGGLGSAHGSPMVDCPDCGGAGVRRIQQGFFVVEQFCQRCRGTGKIIKNPCPKCGGSGRISKTRDISVKIPPGINSGNKIKLSGEGEAGLNGGEAGDLFVFVEVKRHDIFEREKNDLLVNVGILPTTAMIGGEIEAPAIEGGKIPVKIPAGIQHGGKIRVLSRGMPALGGGGKRGDLVISVNIEIPKSLSGEERKLVAQLDESLQKSQTSGGFFKKFFS
ncbi:MAG: molecular chaperone DnaJ [Rickettsiales bacterium]|jgi:molecular chaperone DnaJ|nr:molecular chaperone DnaJ [Rickettsiales bacterium]